MLQKNILLCFVDTFISKIIDIKYFTLIIFSCFIIMNAVYVVSTSSHADSDTYKLGIHCGTVGKLMRRYGTYLIHPIVYYFCYIDSNFDIERALKDEFIDERIIDYNNKKSEWIKLPLAKIIKCLNALIDDSHHDTIIDVVNCVNKYVPKAQSVKPDILLKMDSSDDANKARYNMLCDLCNDEEIECSKNDKKRLKLVKNMLDIINETVDFDVRKSEQTVISALQYTEIIENIANKSLYFKNEKVNRQLFFQTTIYKNSVKKNNSYLNILSNLLEKYNIVFRRDKRIRVKATLEYTYCIYIKE